MPKPVRLAVKLFWISLIIRVVLNLLGTVIGMYLVGTFLITFIMSVLIAVIAYQLGHGSNPARYRFLVVSTIIIVGALSAFTYHVPTIVFDQLDFLITIPLYMYSLYLLFFNKETSSWFNNNQKVI